MGGEVGCVCGGGGKRGGAAGPDENSQYFISLPGRRHRGQ